MDSLKTIQIIKVKGEKSELMFQSEGIDKSGLPTHPKEDGIYVLNDENGKFEWKMFGISTVTLQLLQILKNHQINPLYPKKVKLETQNLLSQTNSALNDSSLIDYTHHHYVTIDNDDSRDLDQAMFIQHSLDDGYIVHYALADASYYVKPDTALFNDALKRGTSFYLPRFSVPMLPPSLSEGLISLNPNVDRRALMFHMKLDKDGNVIDTKIDRGKIHSRAKLSYRGVQEYHDFKKLGKSHPLSNQDYTETLDLLQTVGILRIKEAEKRDVVRYDRSELHIDLQGESEKQFGIIQSQRYDTERWNEQISLLCNMEGAKWLALESDENIQAIYRIHEAPNENRYKNILHFIDDMIKLHGLSEEWKWKKDESVADYIERLPKDSSTIRIKSTIERQFLIINSKSTYSNQPGLHYALATDPYARFSAPMREIVGIFTHKEALEKLYPNTCQPIEKDEVIRKQIIEISDLAKTKQNSINKAIQELTLNSIFSKDLLQPLSSRPIRFGTIMGMTPTRLYVTSDDPPMELKCYVDDLNGYLGEKWSLDKSSFGMIFKKSSSPPPLKKQRVDVTPTQFQKKKGEDEDDELGFRIPKDAIMLSPDDLKDVIYDKDSFIVGSKISFVVSCYDTIRKKWRLIPTKT